MSENPPSQQRHRGSFARSILSLRSLRQHRELLWQFTVRNVASRYKGSYLGAVWAVMHPLLMLALYTFVFGVIFGGKFGAKPNETSLDYALGIFIGLTVYNLISEVMNGSATIIIYNVNFVKKNLQNCTQFSSFFTNI